MGVVRMYRCGVVSGCRCKEVCGDFLIIITYPYSTCISSFLQQNPYFFVHFLMFFVLVYVIFVQYSKHRSKNIRDHSKIEITLTWRYNYIDKNVCTPTTSPETSTCEVPCDVSRKLQLSLCAIMVVEVTLLHV